MTHLIDLGPGITVSAPGAPHDNGGDDAPVFLYFGNHWFAENRTSSHQIARELARQYVVHYFECPGLRAPGGSGRDVKKLFSKLWSFVRGARTGEGGINVRTLVQLPLHQFALVRWLNRILLRATVRWVMLREGIRRPVTWFHIPHVPDLVGRLGARHSIYYCVDDYAAFPNVNSVAVAAMDAETTRRADTVFLASETLLEDKVKLNPKVYLSPHGVDVEHFGRARRRDRPAPPGLAGLQGPVVGFFGLIERWIDLDLVDYLAASRPHWNFVLVGRVAVPADCLPRRPNVHFLGPKPHETLPDYGAWFDVSIIPYVLNRQTVNANPLKLREYLAMGKPIVAVSTPQIEKYADVVEIARGQVDFLGKLDHAITEAGCPKAEARRVARVARESWPARVERVLDVIGLAAPSRPAH